MLKFNCGIYRIRNLINNKCLYGSSKDIQKRWVRHKRNLNNNTHENILLQRSWNKHGEENFVFELIQKCNIDLLLIIEQKFIDNNINGYNLAPAQGGDIISNHPNNKEIRNKISKTVKHRIALLSEEDRKYLSHPGEQNPNWKGGVSEKICPICNVNTISPRANTCSKCRNRSGQNNPFFGKKHSPETIERNRLVHTKENNSLYKIDPKKLSYTKKYVVIYPNNNTEEFYGLKIIAEKFNVSITSIYNAVKKNKPKKSGPLSGISIKEIKR